MTEPVAVYGPWVCVCAVLESSAVAAWLLDPQIGVDERAKRSFAFMFKGFDEQAKFIASWKSDPANVTEVRTRFVGMHRTLSARAARAFAKAIWYRSRQLGWDLPRLAAVLDQSFDVMRIRDSERSWK